MILNHFRKCGWPILKWQITASPTRYIGNWRLRRIVNALLIPFFLLYRARLLLGRSAFVLPQAGITITRRCILNCRDCCALYPHYRLRKAGDIPAEEVLAVAKKLLESVDGVYAFAWAGGEAFLHPDLAMLINSVTPSPKISYLRIIKSA